jgi:hypothetical protein
MSLGGEFARFLQAYAARGVVECAEAHLALPAPLHAEAQHPALARRLIGAGRDLEVETIAVGIEPGLTQSLHAQRCQPSPHFHLPWDLNPRRADFLLPRLGRPYARTIENDGERVQTLGCSEVPVKQMFWGCVRMNANSAVAEREGFEPPIRLPVCRISSAVRSTTLPPLRARF